MEDVLSSIDYGRTKRPPSRIPKLQHWGAPGFAAASEAAVFSSKYPFVHINHQGISRFAFYDPGLAHHIGRQHIMRFITETCLLFYYGQWAMLIGGVLCAHSQKTGPVRRSAHETRGEKEARTL